MRALTLIDRIRLGHIPGLPPERVGGPDGLAAVTAELERSAIRQIDGLAEAGKPDDARDLAAIAGRCAEGETSLRLAGSLRRLAAEGTPLIAAAAAAVGVRLGLVTAQELGERAGSWIDTATTGPARRALRERLTGLLAAGEPLLHAGGEPLATVRERIESLPDGEFTARLPALRAGFDLLTPAGRRRLAGVIEEQIGAAGARLDLAGQADAETTLVRLLADQAGRRRCCAWA